MVRKYAAFISYRHRELDIAVAKKIHKSIERYVIPRDLRKNGQKRLGLVFRDREELPLSSNLTDDIFTALDNSEFLIVVCTPDTPQSLWCRREIQHFIQTHGRQKVITVLAAGTPEESIPREITTVYAEDGVTVLEEYEPLCAYLVDKSPKKILRNLDKELLRLYAAMLNCPYDSLRQRNKRRKMQQALAAASAAFLVALAFIGMLVNRNQKIQAQNAEIAAQNLEIAAQKRDVQLRESELLAADAREALDTGNTRRAIENAVAALPKEGEEDRPYYAPAESVLMEAMDIFGGAESTVLLQDTVLEQMTPISYFDFSPDGSRVVTIDDYNVVHCFDTVTGQELWTDILSNEGNSYDIRYVQVSGDGTFVLCRYNNLLESRDLETGEKLWVSEAGRSTEPYFIYDKSSQRIAVLSNYSVREEEGAVYKLELTILSATDGQLMKTICLEQTNKVQNYILSNSGDSRLPAGGCFSADGRYFACALYKRVYETDSYSILCFVTDLEEGRVVTNYQQDTQQWWWNPSAMEFRGDALYFAAESDDDTVAGALWKLDFLNNELLWQTVTPAELEEDILFTSSLTSYCLFWDTVAFLGRYEKLYAIDLETGEIMNSIHLPGILSSLYTVGDTTFGFSLKEGIYAIGWYNTNSGFIVGTDSFWHLTVQVPEHDLFMPYGGGVIQYYSDGQSVEISISNRVQPGYLAVVGSEEKDKLILKRPVSVERNLNINGVDIPLEAKSFGCSGASVVTVGENTVILGQLYYRDENYDSHNFYMALDRNTHTVTEIYEVEDTLYGEYFFLPDGSGYVQLSGDETSCVYRGGVLTPLTTNTDPACPEEEQYRLSRLIRTEVCYLTDGTVLTVWVGMDTMQVMQNGELSQTAALPEALQYHQDMGIGINRYAKAGRNGLVLSWFGEYEETVEEVFVFNVHTGSWMSKPWRIAFRNENAMAFAETKPWLAMVDMDHMVRILDTQTETEVAAFPLQLPQSSVLSMDFLLDDSCLMVKTKDADILIYDIASGEILYQEKLDTSYRGEIRAYVDGENQRLYILDSYFSIGENALCIDLRSWTTLGTGEKMIFFDEITGELYHMEYYYEDSAPLTSIRIPSTWDLVVFGQELLAESEE